MRTVTSVAALVLLAVGLSRATSPAISPDVLLEHIKFLAADEMKGRDAGSEELERAAEYIAGQFRTIGLQPGGTDQDWFQPFELIAGLEVGARNELVVTTESQSVRLELGSTYYPLAATPNEFPAQPSAELNDVPLVFGGYGLSIPRLNYDDYADIDVRNKAVLIFSHEPQENDPESRLNGRRPVQESTLQGKAAAARNRGALALIVVSDPSHRVDDANYGIFKVDAYADDVGIPVLRASIDEMEPLIESWGLRELARRIDEDLDPRSRQIPGATIDYNEQLAKRRRTVRNVVGVLPGSGGSLAREAIVIGAHYDHVGLGGHLSMQPELSGQIHNGADDNASGTAAIIELARSAAGDRARFPRSLVFIAFAGEERGLLGSVHYTRNPTIDLGSTVAMLNLDMVGRANGRVDVSGLETAPSLERDLRAAADAAGMLEIRREGPGAGRSDDSSFLDRRIPAINFFTGFHDDYHRPSDDWPRIDARGTVRVATLALEFAARIAARPDRPEFVAR
jgi:hypothetical protein